MYYQAKIYTILLKHNVISPRMLFYEDKDEQDFNEIKISLRQHQQSLIFFLNISSDRCTARGSWFRGKELVIDEVDEDEHEDVLYFAKLYAKNGAPIAVQQPSLLEQLPHAGVKVSTLMAAALQPASLHALCRKAVRRMGPKRGFKSWVSKLGLPGRMSAYLCSNEA